MRRVLSVPILLLLLLTCLAGLSVSPLLAQTSPPVPLADVLRGPYEVPGAPAVPLAVPTADVLRGPYTVPARAAAIPTADVLRWPYLVPQVASAPAVPVADVLRGPYAAPVVRVAVSTADVLRGPYLVPQVASAPAVPVVVRGDQPLADILRGPYDAPQPVPIWPTVLAWVLAGLALIALLAALVLDLLRRKRQAAHLPTGARPLGHAH